MLRNDVVLFIRYKKECVENEQNMVANVFFQNEGTVSNGIMKRNKVDDGQGNLSFHIKWNKKISFLYINFT